MQNVSAFFSNKTLPMQGLYPLFDFVVLHGPQMTQMHIKEWHYLSCKLNCLQQMLKEVTAILTTFVNAVHNAIAIRESNFMKPFLQRYYNYVCTSDRKWMFSKIGKLSLKIITTLKKIIYINIRYSFKKGLIKKQKLASV